MKKIGSYGIGIFLLCVMFMVSGGSLWFHSGCDQCEGLHGSKSAESTCQCCHKATTKKQDSSCKCILFAFDAQTTPVLKVDVREQTLRFLAVSEFLTTTGIVPGFDAAMIGDHQIIPPEPPPQPQSGGRYILSMNVILLI